MRVARREAWGIFHQSTRFRLYCRRVYGEATDGSRRLDWRMQVRNSRLIVDHLIAHFKTEKARIRLCDGSAVLTLKGQRRGLARCEYHLPLTWADAQAMVAEFSSVPALEKCRHEVEVAGLIWQVDEYSGGLAGLCHRRRRAAF